LPALAAQWAVGPLQRGGREASAVDRLRITQMAAAGLTVALAAAFLMLMGWVASERDKTLDLSYFRTASPGSAARQIVESRNAPLRVLLFFPPANEVRDQVLGYFRALDRVAENVTIEEFDRLASPEIAQQFRVTQDGSIVLAYNDRSEIITMPVQWREARQRLRAFDAEVQRALMRVAREERTIYLTVGHGELNDPASSGPLEAAPFRSVDALRRLFGLLNYRVAELGLQGGLGNEVPDDAAMVLVLGPARPFLEPELQSLDRYLSRGGSVLLALEPEGTFQLGPLRQRLGIDFHAVRLADDRQHVRLRGNLADRRLIITDRFSSHASLATLGRVGVGSGMLLMGAGYLEPADSTRLPSIVVRSLPSTFADRNGDFEFDEKTEVRKQYSVVAAFDVPRTQQNGDTTATTGRAMVFADAELFSDAVVTSLGLNAALAADAVRWLGREESLGGETTSEEDVPVVHTRAQDIVWFHATLFGAPALVLILGLVGVRRRRRTASDQDEPGSALGNDAAVNEDVSENESVKEAVHR
ncbi:MAG: Gldg family protein, partial [Longimicrobiales bacterium]